MADRRIPLENNAAERCAKSMAFSRRKEYQSVSMIQILPPEVANRIAAGEVVERPASVARELIDNAVDAGAKRIDVEVEDGGLRLIRVTDNGCGMSPDDAALCVKRHATSKIRTSDDLASIHTKGFRGEALAAIASVSRFEIKTRRAEDELGSLAQVEGGVERPIKPTGAAAGTSVTVRDLFYNTPARRKFLKKPLTEQGHVLAAITWNALAHENIHFTYAQNGRRTLDLPAAGNRPERIKQLFGKDILENLIPVSLDSPVISVSGLISRPTLTRNGAQHIFFFVNDRYIKDRLLHRAMMNGYRNLLPAGRFPAAFLYFEIDPREIDVNVHPTKQEIKFSREDAVFSAVYGAIRQAWDVREEARKETQTIFDSLKQEKDAPIPAPPRSRFGAQILQMGAEWMREEDKPEKPIAPPLSRYSEVEKQEEPAAAPETIHPSADTIPPAAVPRREVETPPAIAKQESPPTIAPRESLSQLNRKPLADAIERPSLDNALGDLLPQEKKPEDLLIPRSLEEAGVLLVRGQLLNSYILAESADGLYIIDQHAAHERLLFEKYLTRSQNASLASQTLLFPLTMDFSPEDAALVEEHREVFKNLGFDIEPFGPRTFAIHSIPSPLGDQQAEEFIKDFLGEAMREGSLKEKQDRALHTLACKTAVKFGDPLPPEEMQAIVRGLEKIPRRNVCPHGRPAVLFVSDNSLRRAFKRMGF
ncbi:MAG: DNA mismatch repair endonuclease MutL [Candidatus Omnitrophota bacterium]